MKTRRAVNLGHTKTRTTQEVYEKKIATSFRLSPTAYRLLTALVGATGLNRGACVELAIRELARKHHPVEWDAPKGGR